MGTLLIKSDGKIKRQRHPGLKFEVSFFCRRYFGTKICLAACMFCKFAVRNFPARGVRERGWALARARSMHGKRQRGQLLDLHAGMDLHAGSRGDGICMPESRIN